MAEEITSVLTVQGKDGPHEYHITHPADFTDEQLKGIAADFLKKQDPGITYPTSEVVHKPESFALGALEGSEKPLNNASLALESGLDKIGLAKPINALGEALGFAPSVESAMSTQQQYNDSRQAVGSDLGRFVGETAALLPLSRLPGGPAVQGAVGGGLLTDSRDPAGIAIDAAKGAVGGVIGDRVLRSAAGLIAPQVSNDVRTLTNEGIRPTTGQIAGSVNPGEQAGSGRVFKKVEDVSASVPIAGAGVQNAQFRATQDLNRAAVNRALRPINARLPRDVPVGHDAVRYAGDQLSDAYNQVLPQLSGTVDRTFQNRVQAIQQRAALPPEYQNQLDAALGDLGNAFQRAGPNGAYNGRTLRDASEQLGDLSSAWRRSDDPYVRRVGDVAQAYRDQLHALARRQNPGQAARLRDIDRGYASLVRVERAAQGTPDGVFTPRQYDAAVRGADRSARRRQSARGLALDQDLSGAASRVMANTAAQGGSKDVNSLVALGLLGTRAAGGDPLAGLGLGTVLTGSAAYSQPGQAALRYLMTRQSGPIGSTVADVLRRIAPASGGASAALINGQ